MKILRIYVDTSVLGGCFDVEFAPWSNGLIEDFRRGWFKPVLSEVTAAEVQQAPEPVQAHRSLPSEPQSRGTPCHQLPANP